MRVGIASILAENQRLRRDLAAQAAALAERDAQVAERDAQIATLTVSNEDMAQRLELLRIKASDRRNQRHTEGDAAVIPLPFVFAEPSPPPRLPQPEPVEPPPVRSPRAPSKRRDLSQPSGRPVRKIRCAIDPAAACAGCGGPLKVFAVAHSYRLEWVPGHFETLDMERERCACLACPAAGALVAPPPSFALPKAMCGNGLLARVLVDKFADRIPLNLQCKRMEREGQEFSTTTLSDWVLRAAAPELLGRIAVAIDERLMRGAWLQADDTGYPVQDGLDGKLRKGRLWAVTDQQEVRYHFTDTKEGPNPASFLAKYSGKLLLVDGGSEFNLAVSAKGLLRAGCGAHAGATLFSLIESCAMQGIDPWAYLADVLSRIQEHPVNRVHELTPMNWRLAQEGRASV